MTAVQSLEKSGGPASNQWKPYPAYKPSGVEWLGDVPEGWASLALRRIARRYAGGTPDRSNDAYWDEGTIPWINSGAVNQGVITEPSAFITEDGYRNSSAKWVAKGDLVMALAGQGKTKGMVGQMGIAATCNQSMAAICPTKDVHSRYLYWLLVSQYEHIRNMAGGEQRDGLNLDILGSVPCLQMDPAEQRAIADFLDRETEKIDRLVAKKRELIEKLKEERTALISRTVTRGLNPDAKLKPSGVERLGNVPQQWEVKKLSHVFEVKGRIGWRGYTVDDLSTVEEGVLVLGGTHIDWNGRIVLDQATYLSREKYDESPEIKLAGGELLIVKVGATIGKVGMVPMWSEEATINPNVMILRRCQRDNRYFHYQFLGKALQSLLGLEKMAGAQDAINQDFVGRLRILIPSESEQRAIADFLDRETGKIDRLAAKVEEAIGRLQEYRAALITAAVTGKIDVSAGLNAGVREAGAGQPLEYPVAKSVHLKAAEARAVYRGN